MRVRLIRRWGPNQAGQSVDVDPVQGRWLIQYGYGTASGEPAPSQAAAAPGEDGPDPLAGGGDATRLGPPAAVKGPRRGNNAAPLASSPAAPAPAAASADSGKDSDTGKGTGSGDAEAPAPRTRRRRKTGA